MKTIRRFVGLTLSGLICFIILSFIGTPVWAKIHIQNNIVICSESAPQKDLPDFNSSNCFSGEFLDINPTDKQIWVRAHAIIPAERLTKDLPWGLFISGKASSEAYINGTLVGQNGSPSVDQHSEVPGQMDAVIFIPVKLLKPDSNEIVLKMSSHGGFLNLATPVHWIGLDTYAQPTSSKLSYYWTSLLPLGVLILGIVYFGVAAFRQKSHWLLPIMSLFAAGQLCVEVARGLVAYIYPWHDLRLMLILLFAFGFGMAVLGYTLSLLKPKRSALLFVLGSAVTVAIMVGVRGFDLKSMLAVIVPMILSLAVALPNCLKKQPHALELTLGLSLFFFSVVIAPEGFLDIYLFYIVAGLLIYLFVQQLSAFVKETQARTGEKERGDKLQLIIDQNQTDNDVLTMSVKHSNKVELISVADIAYCKGAGDYVELALINGKTLLHHDNMVELESGLPSIFLRVHRSYIVNTTFITSLERKKSGVGSLMLKNGETVPVSRRIMPSVKEQLV